MYVVNSTYGMVYSSTGHLLTYISMYTQRILLNKHGLDGNKHEGW